MSTTRSYIHVILACAIHSIITMSKPHELRAELVPVSGHYYEYSTITINADELLLEIIPKLPDDLPMLARYLADVGKHVVEGLRVLQRIVPASPNSLLVH